MIQVSSRMAHSFLEAMQDNCRRDAVFNYVGAPSSSGSLAFVSRSVDIVTTSVTDQSPQAEMSGHSGG
ncbi:hypothetical protein CgunFtcFv8_020184 [Champsocephalus gunnari]|uniref:Uncharacterized protein n=1 Tax=Champsocephalus gunnari TaxID=52237 RepID=A0AAN8DMX3_CHAGU|nr:hypothetical protein CgunFtcFv8_020184 [Champsocephalus gunnari]